MQHRALDAPVDGVTQGRRRSPGLRSLSRSPWTSGVPSGHAAGATASR